MQRLPIVLACLAASILVSDLQAQSLQERIQIVREQRQQPASQQQPATQEPESQQIPLKLRKIFDEVTFDAMPARDVFEWWSSNTNIPLAIDWNGMELDGINPDQLITISLKSIPAKNLLMILMQQASPNETLIFESTPWYLQVMTKRQANRNTVVRVYDVADMVMQVPNFTNAPRMDLGEALNSSGSSGGGGGGGGGGSSTGIFGNDNENNSEDKELTKNERGENLARLIRETIEPDIWQENGGLYASARYYDGRLIVNAPMYVHRQIGMPESKPYQPKTIPGRQSSVAGTQSAPSFQKTSGVRD